MAEYITTDAAGKVTREPKGRGRPRSGYVQRPDGNWYNENGKTSIPIVRTAAPLVPTRSQPQLLDEDDNEVAEPIVAVKSDSPDENKIASVTKIKGNADITVADFIRSLHYTPRYCDINEKRIRFRGGTLPQKDLVPGVKFNAVYSQIIIDLTTGNIEILSDNPEYCEVAHKKIIYDALTNVKPEEWQKALRQ